MFKGSRNTPVDEQRHVCNSAQIPCISDWPAMSFCIVHPTLNRCFPFLSANTDPVNLSNRVGLFTALKRPPYTQLN